jgi:hypothetical protein
MLPPCYSDRLGHRCQCRERSSFRHKMRIWKTKARASTCEPSIRNSQIHLPSRVPQLSTPIFFLLMTIAVAIGTQSLASCSGYRAAHAGTTAPRFASEMDICQNLPICCTLGQTIPSIPLSIVEMRQSQMYRRRSSSSSCGSGNPESFGLLLRPRAPLLTLSTQHHNALPMKPVRLDPNSVDAMKITVRVAVNVVQSCKC